MSIERTVENVYLHQDAVTLTRKHFWPLVGLTVLFNLVVNIATKALTSLCDDMMYTEIQALTQALNYYHNSKILTSYAPVTAAAKNLLTSPKFLICNALYIVVAGLVYAGLTLGHCRERLDAVRGSVVRPKGVFALMRYAFKGWRLYLLSLLKVALWALPGLSVLCASWALIAASTFEAGLIFLWLGLALIFVLTIPAGLRYSLAAYILSDEPDSGVIASLRLSKTLMKGRIWQRFKLVLPFEFKVIGMSLLITALFELTLSALGLPYSNTASNIESILLSAGTIYFVLQGQMTKAAFYEKVRWPNPEDKPAKPISYWLQDHSTPPATALPEEAPATSPEDREPENTEEKEKTNEEPVC